MRINFQKMRYLRRMRISLGATEENFQEIKTESILMKPSKKKITLIKK